MPELDGLPYRLSISREMLGLTQAQLAKLARTDTGMVSHWETGRREPTLANLLKINKVLDQDLNWLLTGSYRK